MPCDLSKNLEHSLRILIMRNLFKQCYARCFFYPSVKGSMDIMFCFPLKHPGADITVRTRSFTILKAPLLSWPNNDSFFFRKSLILASQSKKLSP